MPPGAFATNVLAFRISTAPDFLCGSILNLPLVLKADQGTTTNVIQIQSGTNGPLVRFNSFAPANIPDANPNGTNSSIVVSNLVGAIANVSVSLYVTHTYDAALKLELVAPDGTTAVLSANNGSSGDNYGFGCAPDSSRTTFSDFATTPIGN